MYCKNCGAQIDDRAEVCPFCGTSQYGAPNPSDPNQAQNFQNQNQNYNPNQNYNNPNQGYNQGYNQNYNGNRVAPDDAPSGGFLALCLIIPIVGLILYLTWKDTYPMRAKSCGKGAIIGVCIEFAFGLIMGIIVIAAGASLYNYGLLFQTFASLL